MELSEFISIGSVSLVGILSFFVKKALNDLEKLKEADTDNKVLGAQVHANERHFDELKSEMYKKFSKLNIEKERQAEINQDIKLQLSSIEGKLDIIIKGIN